METENGVRHFWRSDYYILIGYCYCVTLLINSNHDVLNYDTAPTPTVTTCPLNGGHKYITQLYTALAVTGTSSAV